MLFLITNYKVGRNGLVFSKPITKLLVFSTDLIEEPIGLSSIHYHPQKDRIYFLTSLETSVKFGGYLWTMSSADLLYESVPPVLVRDQDGSPLRFQHKSEGLTSIDNNLLLIVHDNDRKQTAVKTKLGIVTRELHQSAYSVVKLD